MSTNFALQSFEEKRKLVECLMSGTAINAEKKNADKGITKNKFRNSNSDEVNQVVYENFKDKYIIDTYKENGYEHIRMYSVENKHLYVPLRETTFQEQLVQKDNSNVSVHYLYAYAYRNRWMIKDSLMPIGQLAFLDEGIGSHKELLIQQKVEEVIKGIDVEVTQLITYDVVRGKVISVKARVLNPEITLPSIFEEDLSEYIVSYDNEDESVGFAVEPQYEELSDEMHEQVISDLLKLKRKQKDQDED
ncbi:hypothetical protein DFP93_10697 [Aneurinibacillus soli]|uniref:Uncharacterized protein n=1 Tax=Aneurinibacillus soli TaxID=1500254 RepID=A0A0U4WN86_9BACL|nr:DUF5986 family protein [Aneurinibacillus soli]PYE61904.1 hypothetical protein DFP93_10697 [Aneurinibacillus soli]BAU29720.1 hypothetical protein CB4_03957 [Aneurinibacillus soli]